MKFSLSVLSVLFSATVMAQPTLVERFQKIGTVQQAQQFVDANPEIKPAILKLTHGKDTSLIDKLNFIYFICFLLRKSLEFRWARGLEVTIFYLIRIPRLVQYIQKYLQKFGHFTLKKAGSPPP